jgi:YD repeat-containing protein
MRIHLGANSRPISFEYYTENQETQQTTSATYYYHYDLHGNVIRVTNSSGSTVITYTYDPLGNILTESNSNSIYNPFTYMGEAQVIHDVEFDTSSSSPKTGLYSSGSGYYNPETGTFIQGSGEPATTNPTSASTEEPTAKNNRIVSQVTNSVESAVVEGGPASEGTPATTSSDIIPEEPFEGLEQAEEKVDRLDGWNPNALPCAPKINLAIEFIWPGDDNKPQPAPGRIPETVVSSVSNKLNPDNSLMNIDFGNLSDDQKRRIDEEVEFWKRMYAEKLKKIGVSSWEEFDQLKEALIKATKEAGDFNLSQMLKEDFLNTYMNEFNYVVWATDPSGKVVGVVSYWAKGDDSPKFFQGPNYQHGSDAGFHEGSLWTGEEFIYGPGQGPSLAGKVGTLNPWCIDKSWMYSRESNGATRNNNTLKYTNFTGKEIKIELIGGRNPNGTQGYLRMILGSETSGTTEFFTDYGMIHPGNPSNGQINLTMTDDNGNESRIEWVWLTGKIFALKIGYEILHP